MDLIQQQDMGAFVSSCFIPYKLPPVPAAAMTSKSSKL